MACSGDGPMREHVNDVECDCHVAYTISPLAMQHGTSAELADLKMCAMTIESTPPDNETATQRCSAGRSAATAVHCRARRNAPTVAASLISTQ